MVDALSILRTILFLTRTLILRSFNLPEQSFPLPTITTEVAQRSFYYHESTCMVFNNYCKCT